MEGGGRKGWETFNEALVSWREAFYLAMFMVREFMTEVTKVRRKRQWLKLVGVEMEACEIRCKRNEGGMGEEEKSLLKRLSAQVEK